MRSITITFLFTLISCASSDASRSPHAPQVKITQLSKVPYKMEVRGGLPVDFRMEIDNPFDHPVTLITVEVETVGLTGAYEMKRVKHRFDRTIPPHAKGEIDFRAWVRALQETESGDVNSPVMLRGTARFQTPVGTMQRSFSNRGQ